MRNPRYRWDNDWEGDWDWVWEELDYIRPLKEDEEDKKQDKKGGRKNEKFAIA